MKRLGRGLGWALAVVLGLGVVLGVTALVLAKTEPGRGVLRDAFVAYASGAMRGRVEVGRLREVGLDRLVLEDFRVLTEQGDEVLNTPELEGKLDVGALLDGRVHVRPAWFRGATIRLTDGEDGQVTLVRALEVPEDRAWMPMKFDDVRVVNNTIHIDLPGKPPLAMREVNGLVTLELGHRFLWRMETSTWPSPSCG